MFSLFHFNAGIYENDIMYLGGTVTYTGNVISRSMQSILEEGIVSLGNYSCPVIMERFKDGASVVYRFMEEHGVICEQKLSTQAYTFLDAYNDCAEKDMRFLSYCFSRRLKQIFTLIAQIFCIFVTLFGIKRTISYGYNLPILLMILSAFIVFTILGTLYSYYRCQKIDSHTSALVRYIERNEMSGKDNGLRK